MEDVVMDGDLFHSYHFSLCAGMGDIWVTGLPLPVP